jgi:peptidyl-prolyl cis-trans isomerase D
MLDGLRDFAKTVPGKVLGACLLVGLAGFGINNVIIDLGSNTVARVGGQEISTLEFQRAYQNQLNRIAAQFGVVPTAEQAANMGVPSTVLGQLSQQAALDHMADTFGLGVSDAKLAQMLREDPAFGGTLGNFDPQAFQEVLQRSGLTEAEYFANQTDAAAREQLILSLFGDMGMSETAASLLAGYLYDTRTVDYFVINETGIEVPDPTEEQLATYLAEHQAEFRTPETRVVDILAFSPETLAATKTIPEEEIAAEYEQRRSQFVTPERRTIEQIVLENAEQAALFEQGLAEGRSFEELVVETGLIPASLGTQAQSEITDTALAEAAFALDEGGYAVIEGAAGQRVIHVSAIEEGGEQSLDEVRDEIAQDLALDAARDEYADILDEIESLRAAFQPLSDIAERYGLETVEVPLTAGGAELEGIAGIPEDTRTRVSEEVFAAEEGRLTPAIVLGSNHNIWFDLQSIEPERDLTLEEARDDVAAAWRAEQVDQAVAARVEEIVAKLDAGASLADVAVEYGQFPQISSSFTRSGETGTPIDQTVASAVFAGGSEHHGSAVNANGAHVVFEVVDVTPASEPLDEQTQQALASEKQTNLLGSFVDGVRTSAGFTINQQALDEVLALGL